MNQVEKIFSENRSASSFCKSYVTYLGSLLQTLDFDAIESFVNDILKAREEGKRIIFLGNGGSAATASHFANDIGIGTREYDKPFKAMSFTDNNAIITALGNDNGYEEIFKKQLQVYMENGDIVVVISASGNSENLVRAVDYAKSKGNKTVGLLGFDGGKLKEMCDSSIVVTTAKGEYGPVEDVHMVLDHMIGNYLYQLIRS